MKVKYAEIGICGLSCKLCPRYFTEGKSRCGGCKSEIRMSAGCPFITCAIKKKGVKFCWDCDENEACEKWRKHRDFSEHHDTFICYQKLEDNINFIQKNGVNEFERVQKIREQLLREMLCDFNEGRSKNYYCIAATVMGIDELKDALKRAIKVSNDRDMKYKSKLLHSILDEIAEKENYYLKLRK